MTRISEFVPGGRRKTVVKRRSGPRNVEWPPEKDCAAYRGWRPIENDDFERGKKDRRRKSDRDPPPAARPLRSKSVKHATASAIGKGGQGTRRFAIYGIERNEGNGARFAVRSLVSPGKERFEFHISVGVRTGAGGKWTSNSSPPSYVNKGEEGERRANCGPVEQPPSGLRQLKKNSLERRARPDRKRNCAGAIGRLASVECKLRGCGAPTHPRLSYFSSVSCPRA